jgi:ribonuclease-3
VTRERLSDTRTEQLLGLSRRLGHVFHDLRLLDRALTHKSRANEELAAPDVHNEPLEFLGDAVVGLVVSDLLHRREPAGDEGPKSFARAELVAAASLAQRAADLGLPELLRLGHGEEKTGGRKKAALWANAFEAVVAALYLDGGFEAAHRFLADVFGREVEEGKLLGRRDHKSALQERLQARGEPVPEYVVVSEEGPGHEPHFRVRCVIAGGASFEGEGPSKKTAQQAAACRALEALSAERGAAAASRPARRFAR